MILRGHLGGVPIDIEINAGDLAALLAGVVEMTAGQVAKSVGLSERSIARLTSMQRIPCRRIGRTVRYNLVDVRAALDARGKVNAKTAGGVR